MDTPIPFLKDIEGEIKVFLDWFGLYFLNKLSAFLIRFHSAIVDNLVECASISSDPIWKDYFLFYYNYHEKT